MGEPLELVFANGKGGLSIWPLTGVDAWQAATPIAGAQPGGIIAAARPPLTTDLQLFYADRASAAIETVWAAAGTKWQGPKPLGGSSGGAIATAILPFANDLQLFWRSPGGQIMSMWRDQSGGWSTIQQLPGNAAGAISAIQVPGSVDIALFYRGSTGVQILSRDVNGNWSETPLGGVPGSDVTVTRIPGSILMAIFYVGENGGVMKRQQSPAGGWTPEELLGGAPQGPITPVILPPPREDVLQLVYHGAGGEVMTMWRDPSTAGFTGESPLGGEVVGTVTAARIPGTQTLGLFYRGANNAVASNFRLANGTWTNEQIKGGDTSSDITAAPMPAAWATTPTQGLTSGSNYWLWGQEPIVRLRATIELTLPLVGDSGFGFQLNCWSWKEWPKQSNNTFKCGWQQYAIAVTEGNQLAWSVQNWQPPQQLVAFAPFSPFAELPDPNTMAPGWLLTIELGNDSPGNVDSVTFVVVDDTSAVRINKTIVITDIPAAQSSFGPVPQPTQADLAPIAAGQMVLVAAFTQESGAGPNPTPASCVLSSAGGTITYAADTPVTPLSPDKAPGYDLSWLATETGEKSNSVYGLMPSAADYTFTQLFTNGSTIGP